MEKTHDSVVIPMEAGWNDVGSSRNQYGKLAKKIIMVTHHLLMLFF